METIKSRENPRVKRYVKLAGSRRERETERLFAAEGVKLCMDALKSGLQAAEVYATQRALEKWPQVEELLAAAEQAFVIDGQVAEKMADVESPQGLFALFKTPERPVPEPADNAGYLLLDGLQDPGNLGTIIRTAEALGLSGAVCAGCPDIWSPKVLRAAMGGVFRFNAWSVPDIRKEVLRLKNAGVKVFAAALTPGAEDLRAVSLARPCAVLLGNEGAGLPDDLIVLCTAAVKIPIAPGSRADSLCVAAAAGIFAWEMTK